MDVCHTCIEKAEAKIIAAAAATKATAPASAGGGGNVLIPLMILFLQELLLPGVLLTKREDKNHRKMTLKFAIW
jgi:hypothetical protein